MLPCADYPEQNNPQYYQPRTVLIETAHISRVNEARNSPLLPSTRLPTRIPHFLDTT